MKALLSYQENCTSQNIAEISRVIFCAQEIEIQERDFNEEPVNLINDCDFIVSICSSRDDSNYWENELDFVQNCNKPVVLITCSSLLSNCSFMDGVCLIFIKDEWSTEAEEILDELAEFQISLLKVIKEVKKRMQVNCIFFNKIIEFIEEKLTLYNIKPGIQERRRITEVQVNILAGLWEDLTYEQIANKLNYAPSTIRKDYAPKLWQLLQDVLEIKPVNLRNFKPSLERMYKKHITNAK